MYNIHNNGLWVYSPGTPNSDYANMTDAATTQYNTE